MTPARWACLSRIPRVAVTVAATLGTVVFISFFFFHDKIASERRRQSFIPRLETSEKNHGDALNIPRAEK